MKDSILILGGLCMDRYHYLDEFPAPGCDTVIMKEALIPGGCALNVSITLKGLGLNPVIYSCVGDDSYSKDIVNYLMDSNLDMQCILKSSNSSLGYCYVFVDSHGERTFMTRKGCEGYFNPETIQPKLLDEIEYIYLTGIYLSYEDNNVSLCSFLAEAVSQGKKIIFDPGPLMENIPAEVLHIILQNTYIMTPSSGELSLILKKINLSLYRYSIFDEYKNLICIVETKGSQGCNLYTKGTPHLHFPALKINIADSNGAGDSFTSGLIYGLVKKMSINDCIKAASICGGLTASIPGPHRLITPDLLSEYFPKK